MKTGISDLENSSPVVSLQHITFYQVKIKHAVSRGFWNRYIATVNRVHNVEPKASNYIRERVRNPETINQLGALLHRDDKLEKKKIGTQS